MRQGTRAEYDRDPDPASPGALYEAELERLERELAALARVHIGRWSDEREELERQGLSPKLRVAYTRDPSYRRILELREGILAERRASKVRRDELMPRDGVRVRREGFGQVLQVR